MKSERRSSIELLRILTMFGVVLLHYNGGVGNALALVQPYTSNYWLLMAIESLCICAVNVFLLISGYFSCTSQHRDPVKAVSLLVQVVLFQLCLYLPDALMENTFSVGGLLRNLLPVNYFVVLYVALYLISPYINILLRTLTQKQFSHLLLLLLIFFSVLPTFVDLTEAVSGRTFAGLNPVGLNGDDSGYTILNFTLLYITGAYLRLYGLPKLKNSHLFFGIFLCTGIILLMSLSFPSIARAYCNPAVIFLSISIFLLFERMSFSSKVINQLAKAAFTVFLFHTYPLSKIHVAEAVAHSSLYLIAHMLLTSVGIYCVSWVIFRIYDWITQPVFKLIRRVIHPYEV